MEAVSDDAGLYARVENFFRTTFATDNALITEAIRRMLAAGGKRLRPRITLLAASACGDDSDEHLHLAAYMELIHVATLIHDDVVDNATTRRGVNATAIDYGNRVSVLAGDYLFAWSLVSSIWRLRRMSRSHAKKPLRSSLHRRSAERSRAAVRPSRSRRCVHMAICSA